MKYVDFDQKRPLDIILLGRIAIDFNPAYNEQVKEEFKPLKKVHMFEMFVGGSPANIAVGVTRHGLKAGFFARVSDDQFGDFVVDYFEEQGNRYIPHHPLQKRREPRPNLYGNAFAEGEQYSYVPQQNCRSSAICGGY